MVPLLRAPPDCVRQVELWLRVLRFDHQVRYQDPQLAAYPSLLVSLASARVATIGGDREAAPQLRWVAAPDCPAGG